MPMTPQQEQWLEEREKERAKVSVEAAKKIAAEAAAKSDKKKGKDAKDKGKDKGKDKDKGKGKDSKGGKDGKGNPISTEEEKIVPKYKSANEFMAKHFPTFEDEEDAYTIGPMRTSQLMEVARVLNACDEYDVTIRENTIKKALLIPQDKPEAICLENLRDEKEGLMINPIAKQYWRRFVMAKGKKGKKKK